MLRATADGRPVAFKLEQLQVTGVFKIRGALNALLENRPVQVVTASGGNHGLGVATAARWLGVPATVFVPGCFWMESRMARSPWNQPTACWK